MTAAPRRFAATACIDWSGARGQRHRGIALAVTDGTGPPHLIDPPERRHWSRGGIADWIAQEAARGADLLIGFDFSFGFPHADAGGYFPGWADAPADARALWHAVDAHSPDDADLGAAGFLSHPHVHRHFRHGGGVTGDRFTGGLGRLRAVEAHQRATGQANSASCFNLVGAAQVGKASLTGMRLLRRFDGVVPIWPFDPVPSEGPMIIEIYTSMAARAAGLGAGRSKLRDHNALAAALGALGSAAPRGSGAISDHAADALLTAAWMHCAQADPALWSPPLLTDDIAATEGWTFGVI